MQKKIMLLCYPGCQALDVAGPVDTFMLTNEVCEDRGVEGPRYDVELVAQQQGSLTTHGGVIRLNVDRALSDVGDHELSELDTFMIAGGFSAVSLRHEPEVLAFIRRAAAKADRIASVCTSAFLFAEAGILNGLRVTTHWRVATLLEKSYPEINVTPDALVCIDGRVWSSGGISAGVDLALAIVEHDFGAEVARSVARMMVMYLARQGGQRQFEFPEIQSEDIPPHADGQIQEIINLIRVHPADDLRRSTLAQRFNLTERTLARRFQSFTGMNIARFVEEARLSHAQMRLEDSSDTIEKIAERSGFQSADTMRRVFFRRYSISPRDYRARFRSALRQRNAGQ